MPSALDGVSEPETLRTEASSLINDLDWSPDGRLLAAGRDNGGISLYDLPQRRLLDPLKSQDEEVLGVAWSPDGQRLAAAYGNGTVRIWAARATPPTSVQFVPERKVRGKRKKHVAYGVAWQKGTDRPLLASYGTDTVIHLWDSESGKEASSLRGHTKGRQAVSPVHSGGAGHRPEYLPPVGASLRIRRTIKDDVRLFGGQSPPNGRYRVGPSQSRLRPAAAPRTAFLPGDRHY